MIDHPLRKDDTMNAQSLSPGESDPAKQRYRSVYRPGLFDGKTVVVTGGGSGMGRCTAHELASLGADLALVGRTSSKLSTVAGEIFSAYPKRVEHVTTHACDIRDEEQVKQTVADIIAQHGRIDGLFNCAGGQFPVRLQDLSLKGWDAVIRNNLHTIFVFSRECFVQWMKDHGGSIVNILADIWGGVPGMAHTGAARGGVWNFTESAACEWGYAGVRINCVAPGYVASAGLDHYDEEFRNVLRGLRSKVPLQRLGTESEISSAVVYLLSEASGFITGSVIRVDGGVPNARPLWKLQPAERTFPYNGFPLYQEPELFDVIGGTTTLKNIP